MDKNLCNILVSKELRTFMNEYRIRKVRKGIIYKDWTEIILSFSS